jgi:hypothetical protein
MKLKLYRATLRCFAITCTSLLALAAAPTHADTDPALEHAKAVLAKGILFDGHNDLP